MADRTFAATSNDAIFRRWFAVGSGALVVFVFLAALPESTLGQPKLLQKKFLLTDLKRVTWKVGDVEREALIAEPSKKTDSPPAVLVFHGHGGNMRNSARSFHLHSLWPEAIIVYPQGLNTASKRDPQGVKPGWQNRAGVEGDRDLKFVDAILATLKEKHHVDEKKIFATGHSNGAGFSYLLWNQRGEKFAGFAPSAGGSGARLVQNSPKPILHMAGEKDDIVPFKGQQLTMMAVRAVNKCDTKGTEWAPGCMMYSSKTGANVVTFIHAGDHKFPAEAPKHIVRFFKEHCLSTGK